MSRVLLAAAAAATLASGTPHVVLLVLDDIGWADVGFHGSNFPTPNIDRMAKSGVQLDRMYVMPQCSPTRAAIMTGRYSFRTGLQHFSTIMPGATAGIPKGEKTLAQTFKSAGYATHMIGKWHIGYSRWSQTPLGQGFDSFYGYLQGQTDYYNRTIPTCGGALAPNCMFPLNRLAHSKYGDYGKAGYDFWDGKTALTQDFGKYTIDAYESRLDSILKPYGSEQKPEKPLFLYFAHQQLHIPLEAPPEGHFLESCRNVTGGTPQVNRTLLCSMAGRMDHSVGLLEDSLRKYGMWNDTLIFTVADNGGMTYWGEIWPASGSSNWPLRGGKTTVFEGGVRAVSFVSGGALPAAARGSTRRQLMHAVDILPTLAHFAGIPLLAQGDGMSAWDAIVSDNAVSRNEIPLNIGVNPLGGFPRLVPGLVKDGHVNYSSIISWPYKVVVGDPYITVGTTDAKRRDGWWTVDGYAYQAPEEEKLMPYRLYNLETDEQERHNLAELPEHKELLMKLVDRVKWYASPASGWVKPQNNQPRLISNPRWHDWTWAPFMWGEEEEDTHEEIEVASVHEYPVVV